MTDKPTPGDVFRYPFLWKRQESTGESEGRKTRPVCIAVTSVSSDGGTLMFILPLTTQPPLSGRLAVAVPMTEARRAGLDPERSCWVMLDELNTDVLERSYVFEDREALGSFSRKFTRVLQSKMLSAAKKGSVVMINRGD